MCTIPKQPQISTCSTLQCQIFVAIFLTKQKHLLSYEPTNKILNSSRIGILYKIDFQVLLFHCISKKIDFATEIEILNFLLDKIDKKIIVPNFF